MLVAGSNRRVFGLDSHAGIAVTGLSADGRQLVNRAREEAQSYADSYGSKVVPSILANRLALYMHYFTLHSSLRPFGSTALIAAYDEDLKTPELYMMEPSGVCFRYFGCAAGKGAQAAKTELEKLLTKFTDAQGSTTITAREAVAEIAKMLVSSPLGSSLLSITYHTTYSLTNRFSDLCCISIVFHCGISFVVILVATDAVNVCVVVCMSSGT
jgi:20S proteasome subunit alpha 7